MSKKTVFEILEKGLARDLEAKRWDPKEPDQNLANSIYQDYMTETGGSEAKDENVPGRIKRNLIDKQHREFIDYRNVMSMSNDDYLGHGRRVVSRGNLERVPPNPRQTMYEPSRDHDPQSGNDSDLNWWENQMWQVLDIQSHNDAHPIPNSSINNSFSFYRGGVNLMGKPYLAINSYRHDSNGYRVPVSLHTGALEYHYFPDSGKVETYGHGDFGGYSAEVEADRQHLESHFKQNPVPFPMSQHFRDTYHVKAEENINKAQPPPSFPKFGVDKRGNEAGLAQTPQEVETRSKLRGVAAKRQSIAAGLSEDDAYEVARRERDTAMNALGIAAFTGPSWAVGSDLREPPHELVLDFGPGVRDVVRNDPSLGKAPLGTLYHENFHNMLWAIERKHGGNARDMLVYNMIKTMPHKDADALYAYHHFKYGGSPPGGQWGSEEMLASLFNYLHDPAQRAGFRDHIGMALEQQSYDERGLDRRLLSHQIKARQIAEANLLPNFQAIDSGIKRALRHVQAVASIADEKWLQDTHPKILNDHLMSSLPRGKLAYMGKADEDLDKAQTPPEFPKLGAENRRETPIVSSPFSMYVKERALANANKLHGVKNPDEAARFAADQLGFSMANIGGQAISAARNVNIRPEKIPGLDLRNDPSFGKAPLGTQQHEDLHGVFNRVFKKHGLAAKHALARNIFQALPHKLRNTLEEFQKWKTDYHRRLQEAKAKGEVLKTPASWHEEHFASLMNYLNDPIVRSDYRKHLLDITAQQMAKHPVARQAHPQDLRNAISEGSFDQYIEDDKNLKRAFRHIQKIAKIVDKNWLVPISSEKLAEFHKSEDWKPSSSDYSLAEHLLGMDYIDLPEFRAAKFIAGDKNISEEDIERAISFHEDDFAAMALCAYGIEVNAESLNNLQQVMSLNDLEKAEVKLTAIPRLIKPFHQDGEELSRKVQEAFNNNFVFDVKLKGKHSGGSALVYDEEANKVWFLKPGSGGVSRAAGVRDETASSSRREVAFNTIGRLMGLHSYLPEAHLLIVDGMEVAALEFFKGGFKGFDIVKKEKLIDLQTFFDKYLENGLLYKWAVMDYLLGQTDRHAGNMLVDDKNNIKFIDAGSAFAGINFNPGADPKSFVPFYLRAFSSRSFKVMSPQERFAAIPKTNKRADTVLAHWINALPDGQIVKIMNEYGINPDPFLRRLKDLRSYVGPKSEYLAKFYSNLLATETIYVTKP